tara:strand:- start:1102 stop:1335 length:234 start_codon:yes stop_codon:yes gene_type:complete
MEAMEAMRMEFRVCITRGFIYEEYREVGDINIIGEDTVETDTEQDRLHDSYLGMVEELDIRKFWRGGNSYESEWYKL